VTEEAESIRCLVYIGLPENPQFLGPQDSDALAKHILKSKFQPVSIWTPFIVMLMSAVGKGPSGQNKEYLYNLETALLGLSKDSGDDHVSDLVRRCLALEDGRGEGAGEEGEALHRVGSTEEQEEVEK
jgi:cation transport protein ChaC